MIKLTLPYYECSESGGEYFLIYFSEKKEENCEASLEEILNDDTPYFLFQRQFELPDGNVCHIETIDPNQCSHCKVLKAVLKSNLLYLKLKRNKFNEFEISFDQKKGSFIELIKILKIMVPHAEIIYTKKC